MRSVSMISFLMIVGVALAANSSANAGNESNNAHIIQIIASILNEWLSSHQNQTTSDADEVPQARFYSPILNAVSNAQNTSGNGK